MVRCKTILLALALGLASGAVYAQAPLPPQNPTQPNTTPVIPPDPEPAKPRQSGDQLLRHRSSAIAESTAIAAAAIWPGPDQRGDRGNDDARGVCRTRAM